MATRENREAPDAVRRLFTVRNGSLFFLAFCVGITFISVGITAALALVLVPALQQKMGPIGQIFESVNAAFSGLGFVALVITFRLQYDEFRLQRKELENQHSAMDKSQGQLRRSAECDIREHHVTLIKMAMDDEDLAEVWPEYNVGLSAKVRKQHKYANLIIQHQRMLYELGVYESTDAKTMLHYLMTSPVIRGFWETCMVARQVIVNNGSLEWAFNRLIDAAYNETRPPEPPFTPADADADVVDLDSRRQSGLDAA
jgi:hypothetical protein